MNRFRNLVVGVAAVVLILQIILFTSPGQALAAQVTHALVTNTVSNPVIARIVNTAVEPVLVRDIDASAPQDYEKGVSVSYTGGATNTTFPSVPAGKRLEIETISVSVLLPAGHRPKAVLSVTSATAGQGANLYVPLVLQGTFNGQDIYVGTETVHIYNDSGVGSPLIIVSSSDPNDSGLVSATIAGHLVTLGG